MSEMKRENSKVDKKAPTFETEVNWLKVEMSRKKNYSKGGDKKSMDNIEEIMNTTDAIERSCAKITNRLIK